MSAILITGMSGTGKSTVIDELRRRRYDAVETDEPGWCVPSDAHDSEWLWDEEKIARLLDDHAFTHLFLSGTRENQAVFYERFDHVVLFTAPLDVMLARIATRASNQFGRDPVEREAIIHDSRTIEPLLRRSADIVIDTSTMSPESIADRLVALLQPGC